MDRIEDIIKNFPKMQAGEELISALTSLPEYDENIINASVSDRLIALSELYQIYIPSQMSLEIYHKLYLALLRSLQKKGSQLIIQQRNENHKQIIQQAYHGIVGGSDSFTIIGSSGIGKSSAINRAINLISANRIIEIEKPYTKIIPCVVVQCPFDASVKGLLIEILRKVDECLGSNYYRNALKRGATTDMLIGCVSQVALNNIGLLIVDEIQNVVNSKNGRLLVGSLTQLLNSSGISICLVGTPETGIYFEQAFQLARRTLGLQYHSLDFNDEFINFCSTVFKYQFLKKRTEITENIIYWLYEHSGGNVSVVISILHDAQEIAILSGEEELNCSTLKQAYEQRLSMLHGYLESNITRKSQTSKVNKKTPAATMISKTSNYIVEKITIAELVTKSKMEKLDIVQLLKEYITVEVIKI